MITFYASVSTGEGTYKEPIPMNIVKITSSLSYQFQSSDYPIYCGAYRFGSLEADPIDLMSVVRELWDITVSNLSGWDNHIGESIYFFETLNINTKMNWELKYLGRYAGTGKFILGDVKRGIYYRYNTTLNTDYYKTYLLAGNNYSTDSFEALLESARLNESLSFEENNYNNWLDFPAYAPISLWQSASFMKISEGDMLQNNSRFVNLSRWTNFYTMLTGKYYYVESSSLTEPVALELAEPVNGIDKIEITFPITATNEVTIGNNTDDGSVNFSYWNVGTDITTLFDQNSNAIQEIELKGGAIRRVVADGVHKYSLLADGKGLVASWNYNPYDNQLEGQSGFDERTLNVKGLGVYLVCPYTFANLPVNQWLSHISEGYDSYEYGNAPLFFASYVTNGKTDYFDFDEYPNAKLPSLSSNIDGTNITAKIDTSFPIDYDFWKSLLQGVPGGGGGGGKDPAIGGGSIGGGYNSEDGGDGQFDDSSTDIDVVAITGDTVTGTGLFHLYAVNDTILGYLGRWLNNPSIVDLTIGDKQSAILSLKRFALPSTYSGGALSNIEVLSRQLTTDSGATAYANVVEKQFITYNLGSYKFEPYFDNFLDESPYTQIQLYLPFVGTVDLDASVFMGGTITLTCTVDLLTGSLSYNLKNNKDNLNSVTHTWSGTCAVDIPLTQLDYSAKVTSSLNALVSGVTFATAVASGAGAGALIASGASAASNTAESILAQPKASGSVGSGNIGFMNPRIPYIIINRPEWSVPEAFGKINGFRSNISMTLGDVTGYVEVEDCHLENMGGATENEISEILSLLKDGVIF